MTTPEQNLWVSVIAQQFTDAVRKKTDNDVLLARNWLESNTTDFKTVCYLAGLNPEWVIREWKMIKSGEKNISRWKKS
tara:strand:- start:519 stop:752 length:234 start_codon:yes stop_codon:yes gene_type:complete